MSVVNDTENDNRKLENIWSHIIPLIKSNEFINSSSQNLIIVNSERIITTTRVAISAGRYHRIGI